MTAETKSAGEIFLPATDYDLAATLDSGQVFRWTEHGGVWHGVIGARRVQLRQRKEGILALAGTMPRVENEHLSRTVEACPDSCADYHWLSHFLQTDVDLEAILRTFPDDEPMNRAVAACRGLRLLRQDPWECLASFILSATKQIVQIRQIVSQLCECFGERLATPTPEMDRTLCSQRKNSAGTPEPGPSARFAAVPPDDRLSCAFPSAERIAGLTESQLRHCKMGFRAPHLLNAAQDIAGGKLDLELLRQLSHAEAEAELMKLRGVGKKIANCVLLFAYGFDSAFPVDVWIERALRTLYFPRRRISEKKLLQFAATHFGPHAGYAQQYLFHYMRVRLRTGKNGDDVFKTRRSPIRPKTTDPS